MRRLSILGLDVICASAISCTANLLSKPQLLTLSLWFWLIVMAHATFLAITERSIKRCMVFVRKQFGNQKMLSFILVWIVFGSLGCAYWAAINKAFYKLKIAQNNAVADASNSSVLSNTGQPYPHSEASMNKSATDHPRPSGKQLDSQAPKHGDLRYQAAHAPNYSEKKPSDMKPSIKHNGHMIDEPDQKNNPSSTIYGVQHVASGGTGYQANGPNARIEINSPKPEINASNPITRQTKDPNQPWITEFTIQATGTVTTGDLRITCTGQVLTAGISRINDHSFISGSNGPDPQDANTVIYQLGPEQLIAKKTVLVAVYSLNSIKIISASLGAETIHFPKHDGHN